MIPPNTGETKIEYMCRVVPRGKTCPGCPYHTNSFCDHWEVQIYDDKKYWQCKKQVGEKQDMEGS